MVSVMLSKSLTISVPWFPHLQNSDDALLMRWPEGLSEIKGVKELLHDTVTLRVFLLF